MFWHLRNVAFMNEFCKVNWKMTVKRLCLFSLRLQTHAHSKTSMCRIYYLDFIIVDFLLFYYAVVSVLGLQKPGDYNIIKLRKHSKILGLNFEETWKKVRPTTRLQAFKLSRWSQKSTFQFRIGKTVILTLLTFRNCLGLADRLLVFRRKILCDAKPKLVSRKFQSKRSRLPQSTKGGG